MIPKILGAALGVAAAGTLIVATPALASTPPAGGTSTGTSTTVQNHAKTTPKNATTPAKQTADEYAAGVVALWNRHDAVVLAMLTTPEVDKYLEAHRDLAGKGWVKGTTEIKGGTTFVTYTDAAAKETLRLGIDTWRAEHRRSHGDTSAIFSKTTKPAGPQTADEYAEAVSWAWNHGNTALLRMLTTPKVYAGMERQQSLAREGWTKSATSVAGRSTEVTFTNKAKSETLVLTVDTYRAENRIEHGVTGATFSR